ncbi:MAG: PEGA domain-containing protein, partial [Candidatus Lindowbacteria bacterium]|nr:PEGA domain-containing protein [Candidatus Lindowbacteria bacterium]
MQQPTSEPRVGAAQESLEHEQPELGDLRIRSRPEGADVFVDGEAKGVAPLVLRRLPAGEHRVELRKDGYKAVERTAICWNNAMTTLTAKMEMTSRFAAAQSVVAGDNYMKKCDFGRAVAAYERALSLDSKAADCSDKLVKAKDSFLTTQTHGLLASLRTAMIKEDVKAFVSLLDESDPAFVRSQKEKAENLFSEFDNITESHSSREIRHGDDGQLILALHRTISGTLAENGRS